MISKTLALLGFPALALVGASLLMPAAAASSVPPGVWLASLFYAPDQTVQSNGPAICNCTGSDAELTVCHSDEVNVTVGGNVVSVSTGQSSSSCGTQTVPPGNCLYMRYTFQCSYTGFFAGWECHFISSSLRERETDPETEC